MADNTDEKERAKTIETFNNNIYFAMDILRQPYSSIMEMALPDFINALKWKSDFEEEKRKQMEAQQSSGRIPKRKFSR